MLQSQLRPLHEERGKYLPWEFPSGTFFIESALGPK